MQESPAAREIRLLEMLLTAEEGLTPHQARQRLGFAEGEFDEAVGSLRAAGLIRETDEGELADLVSPEATLARVVDIQHARLSEVVAFQQSTQAVLKALGDRLVSLHAERELGEQMQVLRGPERITAALEDAAYRARKEILSLHPGVPLPSDALDESRARNQRALDRGVRMRSVHLNSMLRVPHGHTHVRALLEAGVGVRVAPVLPFRLIIVDRTLTFTSIRSADGEALALRLQGKELGHLLYEVFEYCWLSAQVVDQTGSGEADGEPLFSEREIAVIRMLFEGRTDNAMARALGVSPRTLRRLMTAVMDKLGAESRFQAGVRAAELGLVGKGR